MENFLEDWDLLIWLKMFHLARIWAKKNCSLQAANLIRSVVIWAAHGKQMLPPVCRSTAVEMCVWMSLQQCSLTGLQEVNMTQHLSGCLFGQSIQLSVSGGFSLLGLVSVYSANFISSKTGANYSYLSVKHDSSREIFGFDSCLVQFYPCSWA